MTMISLRAHLQETPAAGGNPSEPTSQLTHDAEELLGSNGVGLLLGGLKVLLLTDIGHEGDDLVPLVDEPGENARSV